MLQPNSADLVRMLEQKWTLTNRAGQTRQKQRDPSAWKASLSHRWAILKLEKDTEADKRLERPAIDIKERRLSKSKKPQKSVNELLREMRLGDEKENNATLTS